MDRRKFIGACTCCAFAGAGAMFLKGNNFDINSDDADYMIKHIEVHLAEHCNLNCKYCFHFSPIAQKEFPDLDKYRQDVKQLSHVINKKLFHFALLGGEPLLNPQINEYVKVSKQNFPETLVGIVTNAILLNDMHESFWKTLNEYDVCIVPAIYPIKIDWKSVLEKAEKYNVKILGNFKTREKLTTDNIENYRIKSFHKITLNEKENIGVDNSKCKTRLGCNFMQNGKLYPCYIIPNIRHFNKKFGTNFTVSEGDYLDLYKAENLNDVKNFLNTQGQFPFCRYCSLHHNEVKWEASLNHDIKEWV